MSEQQGWWGVPPPERQHIDSGALEVAIPVIIACCGCGAWLDAGPSVAAGWLPVLVQCPACGAR